MDITMQPDLVAKQRVRDAKPTKDRAVATGIA